jgi:uncharacterized protein (TIGR03118 family)
MHLISGRFAMITGTLLILAAWAEAGPIDYFQTNLVTNDQSVVQAQQTDPNLVNPWGLAFSTTSPIWVADQGTGVATVYRLAGATSSGSVLNPPPMVQNLGNAPPSDANGPTGEVSTGAPGILTAATDFQVNGSKAAFIFANLDGSISAWKGGAAQTVIQASVANASFTGLAIGNATGGAARIYAADQNSSNVYMFNSSWQKIGSLVDPGLPAGFTAFNVQNIKGNLFVTYANPNNPLGGIVDEFTTDGAFVSRIITDSAGAHLQTPWGLALAPANWGQFGGDLLVGNNDGDGTINAYSLAGAWQGQLDLNNGTPFSEAELWGLTFGSGSANGGAPDILYFAAGLDGATNGLFGALTVAPEPSTILLALLGASGLVGGFSRKKLRRQAGGEQG